MKKADLNTLNGRFRQVRIDKRLTQDEYGQELGLTRMGVNAIETGRYNPTLEVIVKIRQRFNIPYSWLLDGNNKDQDTEKLIRENENLRRTLKDQQDLIDTQKKLIAAIEK
jgi:putative transcriptional regulator